MKLVHPDWEQSVEFKENRVNVICIENQQYFTSIIVELKNQIENGNGKFILSDNNKAMEIKNNSGILFSPFLIDLLNKRLLTAVFKEMREVAMNEEIIASNQIKSEIISYMLKVSDYLDYDVVIPDDFDVIDLFKSTGITLNADKQDIISTILDYVILCHRILKWNIVFAINLKSYFDLDQLKLLYENILQHKIHMVILENSNPYIISGEKLITIDNDLCEI